MTRKKQTEKNTVTTELDYEDICRLLEGLDQVLYDDNGHINGEYSNITGRLKELKEILEEEMKCPTCGHLRT